MKKVKTIFLLSMMAVLFILLTACGETTTMKSVSEPVKEVKKEPKLYEDTLEIGTAFYSSFENEYIYSGLVNDSILITILKNDNNNNSNSLPLYIPVSRTSPIDLPYSSASIQIKEVNKEDGEVKLKLMIHE
ncbi:hypothetical protein CVD28_04105 [Bacillus sp. M6-12]|uniref:hypothetical protein n=1 Tax=Bacillus sp. M6-12 TaxID=2054166 RepID=UPI000C78C7A4|nr:hypothetical protein [Bacillus sp. M6-12]PLS19608.1 hypothetical protein CVD28_04105 [Bacillus sp. M6-12]